MAFITRLTLGTDQLPELEDLLSEVEGAIEGALVLDEETLLLLEQEQSLSSWCPWPSACLGLYVEGASTRGVGLSLERAGVQVAVRVSVAAPATWTDWELGVHLVCALLRHGNPEGSAQVEGVGQFAAKGMIQTFLDTEDHYLGEIEAGWSAVGRAIEDGRRVRIGGPAGFASIGPRCWERLRRGGEPSEEADELAIRLVTMIQASIEGRGFEDFEEANPLVLDGHGGRRIVTCLLTPGRDVILRDPEYILLSANLESDEQAELLLLPFDGFEDAFPALATWLDERCCAVPALPRHSWPALIERIRPLLTSVPVLLDSPPTGEVQPPDSVAIPFPTVRAAAPRPELPERKWWQLW